MIAMSRFRPLSPLPRRFAGQGLFVLAAAGATVMLLAAEEHRPVARSASAPADTLITWSSAIAPDGKLQQRHGGQPQERDLARLFTAAAPSGSAAHAMPLTLDWALGAAVEQEQPARRPRVAKAPQLETVKLAAAITERPRAVSAVSIASEPLVIRPLEQADPKPSGAAGVLEAVTRPVTATVARATGLVSGAASAVGSAGSWTFSQAAGLMPRF
jgi:hypothetical protein